MRPDQRNDWRVAPLSGDLSGLTPVQQIIGSLDPLADDAHALKQRLDIAGVINVLKVYPGVNMASCASTTLSDRGDMPWMTQ